MTIVDEHRSANLGSPVEETWFLAVPSDEPEMVEPVDDPDLDPTEALADFIEGWGAQTNVTAVTRDVTQELVTTWLNALDDIRTRREKRNAEARVHEADAVIGAPSEQSPRAAPESDPQAG